MLLPTHSQSSDALNLQTTTLILSGGSARAKDQGNSHCMMDGDTFSLHSAPPLDSKHWIVRSPSIVGWNTLTGNVNIALQWKIFIQGLARMHDNGCSPAGLTALQIRAAIAQRISLPAKEVPLFFYSDQGLGFTDLAPGMEIRLQRFLPAAKSISPGLQRPPQTWVASYEVIAREREGVGLKLTGKVQRGPNGEAGSEERGLLSLSQQFAQTPVLRLFLEGVYGTGQVSHGILIGASSQRELDALTDLIHQSDPAKCVNYQETVCTELPLGAVSLSLLSFL